MRIKSLAAAAAVSVAAIGGTVVTAGPSSAATCSWNQGCLYYSVNLTGAKFEHYNEQYSYNGNKFLAYSDGSGGAGTEVDNGASSAYNSHIILRFRVWSGYNMTGDNQTVNPSEGENYNSPLKKKNSSGRFVG